MDRCIHHLFEDQVSRTPQATALVFEDQRFTYAELNGRANQVAHYLHTLGVGTEALVGVCLTRSPEMLVGMLGILKAGAAYVALDPAYPRVRLAFMIEDAAMPLVLTQQDVEERIPENAAKFVCLDSDWDAIAKCLDTNPTAPVGERNLAYILYTSGSTGRPKGVAIEHHSVVVFLDWVRTVFPPAELVGTLAGTSICFDLSVFEIFGPLTCGGAVILAENVVALPSIPARNAVTLINTVPSAMSALVGIDGVPEGVRVVNLAGEPLQNKLVQDIYRPGHVQKVYNLYGPSEDTTYSTYVLCEKGADRNPTIGIPIDNTQVYIVDDQLRETQPGVSGELCLAGDGLARGYLNRPDMTDAKFVQNPLGEGRLYRTGDLARWLPDGNIEFLGRMDHQVKVRGFRIELGEIETALDQHPALEGAVVLAQPDSRGEQQLAAYLVARPDALEALGHIEDVQEHVALWRNVYEDAYRQNSVSTDLTFNTRGWESSYTGEPIPESEMREWLGQTIELILSLRPQNVLEIGCGTGMLVAGVAPVCASYVGLDISSTALDHIRTMQQTLPGLDRVTLYERAAHQLDDFAPGQFDTVIINSVIQHFPDLEYFTGVINQVARLVKPGGHVLIGDILNFDLLETFHTSVQVYRATGTDSAALVRHRVRQRVAQERDLMLAPSLFPALAGKQRAITHVEVTPKQGRSRNQLTTFRYDVVLHVGGTREKLPDLVWIDWARRKLTVEEVRRLLEARPETLAFRNIPNDRLNDEAVSLSWLREAGETETIGQLRSYLKNQHRQGIDPEDLRGLKDLGYRVELSWIRSNDHGSFDAVLVRDDVPQRPISFDGAVDRVRPWAEYGSHPRRAKLHRQLIPEVRRYVEEKLPHYMMPASFTVLDQFPLTPTGKLDRRALARFAENPAARAEPAAAPALSPLEEVVVGAWSDALNLSRVGLDDNFFSLGGNSLSAVALTHRLQKDLGEPIRPMVLLKAPTVAEFVAYLQTTYPGITGRSQAPVAAGPAIEMYQGEI